MKRRFIVPVFFALGFVLNAQDNRTLMTIGSDRITAEEFLAVYNKNNTNNTIDRKSLEEYLELFINFKLKVKEAQSLGMDTSSKFLGELSGYRRQLAQPYLVDRVTTDKLIEEAYERMKWDVAAYHVLIRIDENAKPVDTLAALKRIRDLKKSIRNEKDMLAAMDRFKLDNDESTIGEDLGYFTSFAMVYPFESVAYSTPVGNVSEPVRTRFGYHLIYVRDKRPARGEMKVAHLLIRTPAEGADDARGSAKERIDAIYRELKSGADFRQLVEQYSEDKGSVAKGGSLPWFGTGRMAPVFEDAAFALANDGDISEPVLTNYGWHIILREDYRTIPEFEDVKATIKKRIERDQRSNAGRKALLEKLKADYALTYNIKNRDLASRSVTNDFATGSWKMDREKVWDQPVLTITDNKYSKKSRVLTQRQYLEFLENNQRTTAVSAGDNALTAVSTLVEKHWPQFVEAMLIAFEEENLDAKYPEFRALMQEYHDGILLFDLMDQKVWSKAVKDTMGLTAFHEAHKMDYMWSERVDASIYNCANIKVAAKAEKLAKQRVKKGLTDTDILTKINAANALDLSIKSGLFSKGDNEFIDKSAWQPGIQKHRGMQDKLILVQIYKVLPPQPKSLNEARGLVTSAYQNQLEAEWVKELRSRYPYNVDRTVFDSLKH